MLSHCFAKLNWLRFAIFWVISHIKYVKYGVATDMQEAHCPTVEATAVDLDGSAVGCRSSKRKRTSIVRATRRSRIARVRRDCADQFFVRVF
jgi:hypothetical protein